MFEPNQTKQIFDSHTFNLNRINKLKTGGKKVNNDSDGLVESIRNILNKANIKKTSKSTTKENETSESEAKHSTKEDEKLLKSTEKSKNNSEEYKDKKAAESV